jgi:raffinose/stachyose/melibiose transport system permease protein
MVMPALLLYVVFLVYPYLNAVWISLFDWLGMGPMNKFVGLDNYVKWLVEPPHSDRFWNAFWHTLVLLVGTTLTLQVLAVALALLISRIRGRISGILKVLYLIPWALAPVVVAVLWGRLLDPNVGAVNALLEDVGLGSWAQPWLGSPTFALPAIILIAAWQVIGFNALIYLAAIQAIPEDLNESAKLAGASSLRVVRSITLPLIRPTLLTMLAIQIIASFSFFEMVWLTTQGGPFYATDVLGSLFYRTGFGGQNASAIGFGQASALAVLIALIVIPSSIIIIRLRRRYDVAF